MAATERGGVSGDGDCLCGARILGQPYIDSLGRQYGNMSGQPMLIFEGGLEKLQVVHRKALEREVTIIPYIHAMFATGYDEANREVFISADAENLDLVGLGIRGPKKGWIK
jgi:hypothetical protein